MIIIHYCSSDYFLGNGTQSEMIDSTNKTIYYNGIANTMSVLKYIHQQQVKNSYLTGTVILSLLLLLNKYVVVII